MDLRYIGESSALLYSKGKEYFDSLLGSRDIYNGVPMGMLVIFNAASMITRWHVCRENAKMSKLILMDHQIRNIRHHTLYIMNPHYL